MQYISEFAFYTQYVRLQPIQFLFPILIVYINSLRAGAPLIIHPGREERAPFEILDILKASGADLSRTVMSHLDRTFFDNKALLEFAQCGCFLEYDFFGVECSHYPVRNMSVNR